MRLWAWYNEFALWSLFAMMITGLWMWLPRAALLRKSRLRSVHLWSALFCLPFLLAFGASAAAIAHRTWFGTGWLVRLHTHAPGGGGALLVALMSAALLALGATGFTLWIRNRHERVAGLAMLMAGGGVAGALIVSMRLG